MVENEAFFHIRSCNFISPTDILPEKGRKPGSKKMLILTGREKANRHIHPERRTVFLSKKNWKTSTWKTPYLTGMRSGKRKIANASSVF
jgi:hypothetical protein